MKKLSITTITSIIITTILVASCARKVARIGTEQVVDLSGKWNNTDSKLVAEELSQTVLSAPWISNHQEENNGKKPVVIIGFVQNKSHEHIDAETFVKDMERSFVNTQRVRLVQGGKKREELRAERADQQNNASLSSIKKFGLENGADYILQGSINSIVDAVKRKKVVYYQINMELTHMQTNEVVWVGEKKIAKYVTN